MDLAFDVLERVQHQIGGGLVFLECEEHEALLKFYQNEHNRFRIFGGTVFRERSGEIPETAPVFLEIDR